MTDSIIPKTYEEWRHCITVHCGLELTPEYINERIAALSDEKDFSTKQFTRKYGREYLDQTLSWFKQARQS